MRFLMILGAVLITSCSFEPVSQTGQGENNTGSATMNQATTVKGMWRLVTIFDASGQLVSTRFAPNVLATANLQFGADGRVSGSSGCNRVGGGYTTTTGGFSLSNFFATKKGCFGLAGDLESLVLPSLSEGSRGLVSGDVLQISSPTRGKLIFKRS